jgi:predicted aminopeptidase
MGRALELGMRALALSLCCTLVCACSLARLGTGQLRLINEQVPLERAWQREPDSVRRRLLQEVPLIVAFAEDVVGLRAGVSYRGYFATEAKGLTYVLTACARTELVPHTWWFPIVGEVAYRSYWDEADARAAAANLEAEGYDTWLSPSRAYSSLGILRDPVATTMLRDGITGLADVLIHELSHARLYVPGQTDWDEALASFVGERGAERYFASSRFAHSGLQAQMAARAQRKVAIDRAVSRAYTQLEQLYASPLSAADKLRDRQAVFDVLTREAIALFPERDPAEWQMNNARILHFHRYSANSGLFIQLWSASGQNFRRFWQLVEAYAHEHF